MKSIQFATRVEEEQAALFRKLTQQLGMSPADALRMFVYSFNSHQGFPYDVRISNPSVEPFETEEDATRFATELSLKTAHEAW